MKRALFLSASLIGFALFASPAIPESAKIIPRPDKADSVIIPAGSSLRFSAFDQEGTAKFDGTIELSGTFFYGEFPGDHGSTGRTLTLFPDSATRARLPRFKAHSHVDSLSLSGEEAFANTAISKDWLAALHRKGTQNLSGHIDIMADRLEIGLQCDAPYLIARFLSVMQRPARVVLKDEPDGDC